MDVDMMFLARSAELYDDGHSSLKFMTKESTVEFRESESCEQMPLVSTSSHSLPRPHQNVFDDCMSRKL